MKIENLKRILIVAGSDCSGGAGVQADIAVARLLHCYPMATISCITAQNSEGFGKMQPVDPEMFAEQLQATLSDIRPDAVKIGMLPSKEHLKILTDMLEFYPHGPVIFDPIIAPTKGAGNFESNWMSDFELLRRFYRQVDLITPNDEELNFFLGPYMDSVSFERVNDRPVAEDADEEEIELERFRKVMERRIMGMAMLQNIYGMKRVLLTGGHAKMGRHTDLLLDNIQDVEDISSIPDETEVSIMKLDLKETDLDSSAIEQHETPRRLDILPIPGESVETSNTHGTGCLESTAIACYVALFNDFKKAAFAAKQLTTLLLKSGADCRFYPSGHGPAYIGVDPEILENSVSPEATLNMN